MTAREFQALWTVQSGIHLSSPERFSEKAMGNGVVSDQMDGCHKVL